MTAYSLAAEILRELGITHAIEMPPGHVPSHLGGGIGIDVEAIDDIGFATVRSRAREPSSAGCPRPVPDPAR
jgi:hypothetical protein